MTDAEFQNRLAEYEGVVRLLTAKCEELAAENAKLRSEKSDALSVLREVYNDPDASPAHRIKAAGLALPHEVPRLESVPPPLDLVAEREPIEPLADVVARRRARADRMMREARSIKVLPSGQVFLLDEPNGNANGDGGDDSND
jgi:hypothetical protein